MFNLFRVLSVHDARMQLCKIANALMVVVDDFNS